MSSQVSLGPKSFCFPLYSKEKGLLLSCFFLRDNFVPFLNLSFSHIFLCWLVGDRSGRAERASSPWSVPSSFFSLAPNILLDTLIIFPFLSYPHLSPSAYNLDKSSRVEPSLIHFCMPRLCIVNIGFMHY